MKILKHTKEKLSIQSQSQWVESRLRFNGSTLLTLGVLMGIPLWIMWNICLVFYGMGITQLSCQRLVPTQVSCILSQTHLFGLLPPTQRIYNQIIAAEMKTETGQDDEGKLTVHQWIELKTKLGGVVKDPFWINETRGSVDEMLAMTTQINRFLASSQTTLTIEKYLRSDLGLELISLVWNGLMMWAFGFVVYMSFQSEKLVFDKTSRQLLCTRHTLLGNKIWECPLNEIRTVTFNVNTDSDDEVTSYNLTLRTTQGQKDFMSSPNKVQVEIACDTIREFLQLDAAESPLT